MLKFHISFTAMSLTALLFGGCYYYDCNTDTEDFKRYTAYETRVDFVQNKIQDTSSTGYSILPQGYAHVDDYIRIYASKAYYEWNVDIYGCTTYQCKDAEKVIIHDDTYRNSLVFGKDEFKISAPNNPDIEQEGDIFYHYFFNLKIDTKNVKIDWDVIEGTSECEDCGFQKMKPLHIAG